MTASRGWKKVAVGGSLAAVAAATLAISAQPWAGSPPRDRDQALMQCAEQREARERREVEHLRREQAALIARIEGADPARDAAAAAARGDFRLIRGITMMGTYPLGVDCRTLADNRWQAPPLTFALRFYSDVPGSCETGGGSDPCRTEQLLDSYGPAYNRALVASPQYPYGDLCRASAAPMPAAANRIGDPAEYGFPDLEPTDSPHDLHEAARRGTAQAVARMIAGAPRAVDLPDPYGLTPLAWAVILRRPDIAARLMAAGASPIGEDCDQPDRPESPLRLALRTGQEALARRMMTPETMRRVTPWPGGLVEAAARGGSASILERMLREERDGESAERLAASPRGPLPAATAAVIASYRQSLCWREPIPAGARVRMIGVYQGESDARSRRDHAPGRVAVHLPPSPRPVFLVLSAYEPVEWGIVAAPGARLAGVLAVGMHRPRVIGAGPGVPVLLNDQRDQCASLRPAPLYVYQEGDEQRRLAHAVQRMIGRRVDDFEGSYGSGRFDLKP